MMFWRALAVVMVLAFGAARAETPLLPETELGAVEQELATSTAAQQKIQSEVAAALAEQDAISTKLIDLANIIQGQETAVSAIEERILTLRKEAIVIRADLAEKQDVMSELLAGLQRLEQNPPPALVVEPHDVLAALRGAMMFGAIVPELRAEAELLVEKLSRLDHIRVGIEAEKTALAQNIAGLKLSQIKLDQLVAQKRRLVSDHTGKLQSEQKRSIELADKAKSLKQLLAGLAAAQKLAEIEKSKQDKALAAEKKRQEAALFKPSLKFSQSRGRLQYPAQGDGLGSSLRGIAVATRKAAQVTTPVDALVEFAGPFRSYGQLLILNAGGGYLVLMAGMHDISTGIGQSIKAGEPVGTMGEGPSSVTLLGDQMEEPRPVLYIEFRNNGGAIDSAPWWIGGMKEARK
jgi:murein hydrolase activator